MSDSGKAVFLSYASQDADAAHRIADALRATGVEVWFDQNELVGGDAWDAKIRKQIKECALFVPVISANTNARAEGYFRLEWKLAVDRSHLMSDDHPFLFPVVIDDTTDGAARVPDKFRDVQWTRLDIKDTPETLAKRVSRLLVGSDAAGVGDPGPASARPATTKRSSPMWVKNIGMIGAILIALIYAIRGAFESPRSREPGPVAVAPTTAPTPPAAPVSEARQLVVKAQAMSLDKYDSSADDYAAAEGLLKQALALDQNDAEAWAFSSLFNTSIRTRGFDHAPARREMARRDAERALKLAPDSLEALYALGRAQRDFEPDAAEQTFKKILARQPDDFRALGNLASIYDYAGRADEAAALYERVAAADPAHEALTRYTEYLLFFHYGRFAEAERCIRRSVAIQPSANSQGGLAMLLLTWKGDADEAARVLATGPTAARNEPRTIWTTAFVQLCRRSPDDVLKTVDRLADDYIQDNWFVGPKAYFAGRAHALAGRAEAARIAWESALAMTEARLKDTPDNLALHVMRGQLLAFLGQPDEALREARAVAELGRGNPRDDRYWFISPALIYAVLGRADDALPLLEKLCAPSSGEIVGWPLTPALLRLDPIWDKVRDDPRFQALCAAPAPATATAPSPARELAAKARALFQGIEATREDFALAEDYCQRALKLDSTDGGVWAVCSELDSAFGYRGWDTSPERREQTRVTAERAIRLAPDSPEAKLAQAGAWSTFGLNRDETEKLLREVVAAQPNNQMALKFLAVTVLNRGRLDECLALNERSAALPGGDPLALFNNARYLWSRDRSTEAYATIQRAIAQKPFSSALVFKTMMDATWRGDLAAAEATLKQIPQPALLEDRASFVAGIVRYYQGRADAALAAWGAFPRDYYADFIFDGPKGELIGLADELDHRDAAAKIEWRTALQLVEKRIAATPNNPPSYYHQAYLLACLGEKAAAGEALRTYEQLAGIKYTAASPMPFALVLLYTRLGRLDDVFAHPSPIDVARLRIDPRLAPLRADPRFETFLEQIQRLIAEPKN